MTAGSTNMAAELPDSATAIEDPSRRDFLRAAAAGVAATTLPIAGIAGPDVAGRHAAPVSALEQILERYGSEFGAVRRVGASQPRSDDGEGN